MKIDINNYEEIMFRLVEDDFDPSTRMDLLKQIELDELFKFEWEAWQKTKFNDPLEDYLDESRGLTEKIILLADPKVIIRKRIIYYWAAAASIIILLSTLFLLTNDNDSKPEIAQKASKPVIYQNNEIALDQNPNKAIVKKDQKRNCNQQDVNKAIPVVNDSIEILPSTNAIAEIPKMIDSVPLKVNDIAQVPVKKPRYTITIETSDIADNNQNSNDLAQNRKGKFKQLFTNTKMLLSRKPNGEPDKIYIIGEENSCLCINLNY